MEVLSTVSHYLVVLPDTHIKLAGVCVCLISVSTPDL